MNAAAVERFHESQTQVAAECCRTDGKTHICGSDTGHCCYSNNEVCPDHG